MVVMSLTITTKNSERKEVILAAVPFLLGRGRASNPWRKTLSYFGTRVRKDSVVEKKVQYLQKKYHCQWTRLRGKKLKWIFHTFGYLLRPLELVPASRERVVPTEWQVRAVLRDCMSRAKVIPTQAPQYRQHALISDFLDLAHLSIREEAALATNWIKDRPEGLKLQNLALATMTGPTLSSFPKILTADVQYAIDKCESLGSLPVLHVASGHPWWQF